jgi:ketosteroid isomerase-like protein
MEEFSMRNSVRLGVALMATVIMGFWFQAAKAQEQWSDAQKEVWQNVNDYWALLAKGDVKGFLDYVHKDYIGWDDNDQFVSSKEDSQKWLEFYFQGSKVPVYTLKPLAVMVYGNVAFADYYYAMVIVGADGKKTNEKGRWTDILMKDGKKWVLIGDNGGKAKDED